MARSELFRIKGFSFSLCFYSLYQYGLLDSNFLQWLCRLLSLSRLMYNSPGLAKQKSLPDNYSVLSSHPLNTSLQYTCSRIIWEQVCFTVVDNGYGSQDLESWCALLLLGPGKPNNTHACTHTDYSYMDLHVSETIQCFTEFLV